MAEQLSPMSSASEGVPEGSNFLVKPSGKFDRSCGDGRTGLSEK